MSKYKMLAATARKMRNIILRWFRKWI